MPNADHVPNSRSVKTRAAIVDAFNVLAFERRYSAIRVSDLIVRADVGKSTFYEHFRGKNDVLLEAMRPIILALATAASGRAARPYIRDTVRHLWELRSTGRVILSSMTAPIIQRRLAEAVEPHVFRVGISNGSASIAAIGIAAAQLAMLQCWLAGQYPCSVDAMTDRLIACSALLTRQDA